MISSVKSLDFLKKQKMEKIVILKDVQFDKNYIEWSVCYF